MPVDDTLGLFTDGYAWLPAARRLRGRDPSDPAIPMRIMGRPAVALRGPEAVRFFYDERHVRRHGAIPEPVRGTLFGQGAVHTLDGPDFRHRKAMFLDRLTRPEDVADVVRRVSDAWEDRVASWDGPVLLFDEAARALTRGVCDWAGIPLAEAEVAPLARDLTAMVDGFATGGPRHWRARRARGRRERWLTSLLGSIPGPMSQLEPHTAAVEILNIIRPTVAVTWFACFTAHALHRWPEHRKLLRDGDAAYAMAFAHETRRFYPFAPFVGGRAVTDLGLGGVDIPAGSLVLLDIFGQDHDETLWPQPYRFDPGRFLGRRPDPDLLIPQGGGDRATGHRCPGEDVTVSLMAAFAILPARLDYRVPPQDLTISLSRIPARPRSRVLIDPRTD